MCGHAWRSRENWISKADTTSCVNKHPYPRSLNLKAVLPQSQTPRSRPEPQSDQRKRRRKNSRHSKRRAKKRAAHVSGIAHVRLVTKLRTIDETAEILNVSTRTVRRLIESGELWAHRIRGLVRISDADIAAYLAEH